MKRLSAEDPRWIGDYRLLGRLGEGGMGRVYLARSGRGRTVAVKAVQDELARQPDFRRRFAQEITAARKVGGALAAGCSLILKASEETPGACVEMVKCFVDAGVPAGGRGLAYSPTIRARLLMTSTRPLPAWRSSPYDKPNQSSPGSQ